MFNDHWQVCCFQIGFDGKSYLALIRNVIGEIDLENYLNMTLTFSTKEPNGLLLWQGSIGKNWIAVGGTLPAQSLDAFRQYVGQL